LLSEDSWRGGGPQQQDAVDVWHVDTLAEDLD
jgi:hypothetical protein